MRSLYDSGFTVNIEALAQLAASGNFKTVEEEWLKALEEDDLSDEKLIDMGVILDALANAGKADGAETLAWAALESLKDAEGAGVTLPVAESYATRFSKSEQLRAELLALVKEVHSDRPGIGELLEKSGLEGSRPVRRAIRLINMCLSLQPGAHLISREDEDHAARVESIDTSSWTFTVTCRGQEDELSARDLADRFNAAAGNDFRAMRTFEPDTLRERVTKRPADVVASMVHTYGGSTDSDRIMSALCPSFIDRANWSKWWSRARSALKRMPNYRLEGRDPVYITYEEVQHTFEDEIEQRFKAAHAPGAWLTVIEEYYRLCRQHNDTLDEELGRRLDDALHKRADRYKKDGALLEFGTLLVAARLCELRGVEATADVERAGKLLACAEPEKYLFALDSAHLWPTALKVGQETLPEQWPDICLRLLSEAPASVYDRLIAGLVEAGRIEDLNDLIKAAVGNPLDNVGLLVHLWEGARQVEQIVVPPAISLFSRLFDVLNQLRKHDDIDAKRAKDIRERVRGALVGKRSERFKVLLDSIDQPMAASISTQIKLAVNLSSAVRSDMYKLISQSFPDLHAKPVLKPWEDPEVIYVTRAGRAAKEAALDELVNVKMRENAIAIGVAAEKGDLSENSEYKFALEERDLLRARVAKLKNEMAKAKMLSPEDVQTDHICIGSRVTFRNSANGETLVITFLGPWESDVDKHIYNYKSPFALNMMGMRIGESAHLEVADLNGEYEVQAIESAIVAWPE